MLTSLKLKIDPETKCQSPENQDMCSVHDFREGVTYAAPSEIYKITVDDSHVGGWPTPLKNIKVSWDDDIPNIWKNEIHVPNHQPVVVDS